MTSLQLGADRVPEMACQLDTQLSQEAIETAEDYARRADYEHPINRSPNAIAGGALYLACMLVNEKVTQTEIASNCDISGAAIRETYQEIAEHEGITMERTRTGRRNRWDQWRPKIREFLRFGGSE